MTVASSNNEEGPFVVRSDPLPGVCVLTLNRPAALNAMTPKDSLELCLAVKAVQKDESVKCVVLTGSGRGFCAGANVRGDLSRIVESRRLN